MSASGPFIGARLPGRWPERLWCVAVGHRWALWTDNAYRRPCTRCWLRVPLGIGEAMLEAQRRINGRTS